MRSVLVFQSRASDVTHKKQLNGIQLSIATGDRTSEQAQRWVMNSFWWSAWTHKLSIAHSNCQQRFRNLQLKMHKNSFAFFLDEKREKILWFIFVEIVYGEGWNKPFFWHFVWRNMKRRKEKQRSIKSSHGCKSFQKLFEQRNESKN